MDAAEQRSEEFLVELYRMTKGDLNGQVSMHDIGSAIGMEKSESGSLAEDLIMSELVELRTLAGGVCLTGKGLEVLQKKGLVDAPALQVLRLSGKPVLSEDDQNVVAELVKEVKAALSQAQAEYDSIEEVVIDIKTLEVQLLSAKPKYVIVQGVFRSLHKALVDLQQDDIAAKLGTILD
ncbi:MAG: hypothetical protein V2I36_02610 [Desulfopila sp.]|nr:hypothetical protein [Desulfopila sp.]